jgi:arginase family enzyme
MLDNSIRILNFDDSIVKQKKLLEQYKNNILDLKDLAPEARLWANSKVRAAVEKRVKNSSKNSPTFLGSGDFHHISEILISQFNQPLTVIVFDFHPDWDTSFPRFGCGSWVTEVLKKKNISKVFLIGVSSNDIDSFRIHSGNLASLRDNRVEIYPYEHLPSKTFLKKVPENVCLSVDRGNFFNEIHWQELKGMNMEEFFLRIKSRISAKQAYVSIDKDCLQSDFALTNWEEGKFSLEEFLLLLKHIKENLDIVGLDIVGDYSPIRIKGTIKKVASYFDHPKRIKAAGLTTDSINYINESTNLKILELINS